MRISEFPPSPDISEDDWAATAATVRMVVGLLDRVARLEEWADKTARTSPKPPAPDPLSAPPRPPNRSAGRASEGQPEHAGHGRVSLPADRVNRVVGVKPEACAHCGTALAGDGLAPACD